MNQEQNHIHALRVVLTTTSSAEEAQNIAATIVSEQLAACCTIVSGVQSVYMWEGTLCQEQEYLLLIKTLSENIEPLFQRISELHSYSVPELVALPIEHSSKLYNQWIINSLLSEQKSL